MRRSNAAALFRVRLAALALAAVLWCAAMVVGGRAGNFLITPVMGGFELGTDTGAGITLRYDVAAGEDGAAAVKGAVDVIGARVNALGYADASVYAVGDTVCVELPGSVDAASVDEVLSARGTVQIADAYGNVYLNNDYIDTALASRSGPGSYYFVLYFNEEGTQRLTDVTTALAASGATLDIFIDGYSIFDQPPAIGTAITNGALQITGYQSEADVRRVVALLGAGELRADLSTVQTVKTSALLGADTAAVLAWTGLGLLVLAAVVLVIRFRLLGAAGAFSLLAFALAELSLCGLLGVEMNAVGIAGVGAAFALALLAIVSAVSRASEELRGGAMLRVGVAVGFRRANATVLESSLAAGILAVAALAFTKSLVRPFGVALGVGAVLAVLAFLLTKHVTGLLLGAGADASALFGGVRTEEEEK